MKLTTPEQRGIRCPTCGCADTRVYYTRQFAQQTRRSRICRNCGRRIPTIERPAGVVETGKPSEEGGEL